MKMKIWINRNFLLLWTGQLISQLGDKFYMIALAWWILQKTHSPLSMGLYLMFSVLPELLIGPIAGVYIDLWSRKVILVLTDILRGVIILTIAALSIFGLLQVWHIYAATILISLCSAFFNPSTMSVIPQVVAKDQLTKANSMSQMTSGLTTIIGPLLGGTTVALTGYTLIFILNGSSYLVSAFLEMLLTIPYSPKEHKANKILSKMKEGFIYIRNKKVVFIILLALGIVHVFYGGLVVAMPFLANKLVGAGSRNLGLLEAAIGGGLIGGGIAIHRSRLSNLPGSILFYAILIMGLSISLIGLTHLIKITSLIPYVIIIFFLGTTIATASVYWRSLLQTHVPNEMTGRVFGIATTIVNISLPLSFGAFGLLLNHFSIALTLIVSGVILVFISFIFLIKYKSLFNNVTKTLHSAK